ncbi:MAG: Txe/YoeB family addiction module toxin [Planctomycetaceae bacterium]|jgi:toxin YoeB|nr:Txe/YoeB family addiction module toxin [Planctomycetaceae bacterium]
MSIRFDDGVLQDYMQLCNDAKLRKRLDRLTTELERNPQSTFAKVDLLKGDQAGQHSMRIDEKHRLVFIIEDGVVKIIQCGEHYED